MPDPEITPTPLDPQSSAGTPNTRSGEDDNRIPYSRFKEVNEQNKALQARLDALEAADRKRKDAELTDSERAKAEAAEAKTEAERAKAQLEAERTARKLDKRDNALAQALATASAIDADDTVTVLKKRFPAEIEALLTKSGEPDPDAIKALVDKAKTEVSYHFRPGGPGSPSNRDGQVPTPEISTPQQALALLTVQEQQLVERLKIDPLKYVKEKYGA